MDVLENYIETLNEDFGFQMKAFKAKVLQKMAKGIKQNIKGKTVNVPAIKKILKPIPTMNQEKINKFLDKYIPNYTPNYNTAKRYFKNKYPTEQNVANLAGATALIASMDKNKTLQQHIKRADRIYSKHKKIDIIIVGLGILMLIFAVVDIASGRMSLLAALLGALLIITSMLYDRGQDNESI